MSFVLSLIGRNGKQKTNKQTASKEAPRRSWTINRENVLFSKDVIRYVSSAEGRKNSTRISKIDFVLCGDKCSSWSFVLHVTCIRLDKARKYGIMRPL